jgi:C4-type Zn-finger protein
MHLTSIQYTVKLRKCDFRSSILCIMVQLLQCEVCEFVGHTVTNKRKQSPDRWRTQATESPQFRCRMLQSTELTVDH